MNVALTMAGSPFAWFVLAAAGACAGVVALTASAGIRDHMGLAAIAALVAAGSTIAWLGRRPGFATVAAQPPAGVRAVFVAGVLAVAAQLAWLTPFIIDPNRSTWASGPLGPFPSIHSCVSSYWVAGNVVRTTPDVYDEALYNLPQADPAAMRRARKLGPFNIDNYEYPPPFLLAPRVLGLAAPDFWHFRRIWFALNFGLVVVAAVLVARRLDERLGTHAVWLTPFVRGRPRHDPTFQAGNVQLAMIALTALAMWALRLARARARRGAAGDCDCRQALPGRVRALSPAPWRVACRRLDGGLRRRADRHLARPTSAGSRTGRSCTKCPG